MRIIAAVMGLLLGLNALVMLFASYWWYGAVPGVLTTGPFNPHFVRDIGAAYFVVAGGLVWFAARPVQGWPALVAAAAFLSLHAVVHVYDAACSASPIPFFLRDLPNVYLPAVLAAAIAVLRRPA
jgi:hypothetical protein